MSFRRLRAIILKELRQLRRDRLTFAMIAGIPIMELLLFGFAINLDVRNLDAAVVDQAGTSRSRELIDELAASRVLDVRYRPDSVEEIRDLLRSGQISAALVVPVDFEERLERGERPPAQLIVDGSDQTVQQATRQLAMYPFSRLRRSGTESVPGLEVVNYYNPEREAAVNTVPGLIGVILTMTMVLFTAIALVRERERGNLEMLIATPVSPWELTIGKVAPFVGIGLVQVTLVLVIGWIVFDVPVRGPLVDLYAGVLVFIVASLSLGILISTLTGSQFQAMQFAFFTFLPQILLSGFMFPFAGMPWGARWFAELLPLTHFVRLVRGIMLRSAGLADLWREVAMLGAFTAVALVVAVARVHKRLD